MILRLIRGRRRRRLARALHPGFWDCEDADTIVWTKESNGDMLERGTCSACGREWSR